MQPPQTDLLRLQMPSDPCTHGEGIPSDTCTFRGGMKAASISKEDGNRTTTNPASYARAKALDEMLKSEIVYVDQLKHIVEVSGVRD